MKLLAGNKGGDEAATYEDVLVAFHVRAIILAVV